MVYTRTCKNDKGPPTYVLGICETREVGLSNAKQLKNILTQQSTLLHLAPLRVNFLGKSRNRTLAEFAYAVRTCCPQSTYICGVQSCVCVFQNIDPPPPSPPSECVLPPHQRRGVHTRPAVKRVGGQYFGRHMT